MRGSSAETNAEADRANPELEHRRHRNEAYAGATATLALPLGTRMSSPLQPELTSALRELQRSGVRGVG